MERQRQEARECGFTKAAEDVRWMVARLEDAWEDRLSLDIYL